MLATPLLCRTPMLAGDDPAVPRQETMPAARQRDQLAQLGSYREGAVADRVRATAYRSPPQIPDLAPPPFFHRVYNEELDVKDVT
jgi:hypothetical protein